MKRLLALLIVCAMASVASATSVEVTVDGVAFTGQDVTPSQWIEITFYDTVGTNIDIVHSVDISTDLGDTWSHAWGAGGATTQNFTANGAGYIFDGSGTFALVPVPEDDIIFTQIFHVPDDAQDSDWITLDYSVVYGGMFPSMGTTYSGSEDIHVTPEPTTIALLGLGALSLLRRRRKA